jgi:hypothetical protein
MLYRWSSESERRPFRSADDDQPAKALLAAQRALRVPAVQLINRLF